jgi:hypothetical protein
MNEKQAQEMLETLKSIERILMNIANNTNSMGTTDMPRTFYYTGPTYPTVAHGGTDLPNTERK